LKEKQRRPRYGSARIAIFAQHSTRLQSNTILLTSNDRAHRAMIVQENVMKRREF
jgi:hypothetical protein